MNKTKISRQWLKRQGACQEGIDWFCKQEETDLVKLVKLAIRKEDEELLGWANWVIARKMSYRQYVAYAIFAARQVLNIWEKNYPGDNRPRMAIEAAEACLRNPSKKNKEAAKAAAEAAKAAAEAVGAAWTAAGAAEAAAGAAAGAAGAATWAAEAAAWAATIAGAAAKINMFVTILKYGIELLASPIESKKRRENDKNKPTMA